MDSMTRPQRGLSSICRHREGYVIGASFKTLQLTRSSGCIVLAFRSATPSL